VVAERFGQRPSQLLKGSLIDLMLDIHVANLLVREEERALERARARSRRLRR
jgi:hypothetical protein